MTLGKLQMEYAKQKEWIESCEKNGNSYSGSSGALIKLADQHVLGKIGKRIKEFLETSIPENKPKVVVYDNVGYIRGNGLLK